MSAQMSNESQSTYDQRTQNVYGGQINVAGDQHIHLSPLQSAEDFHAVRQAYFEYLIRLYAQHVIQGFSPRISGRDVSLPLAKIFLPLKASEGRPVLAEYAEEDLIRQTIGALGELDWQRHSMEMEKRSAQMNVKLSAQKSLSLANLLTSSRAVLLGDPGTGKTTVTRYISYALAIQDYTHTGNEVRDLTPILVRLATYARVYEDNSSLHLIDYIEKELTQRPEYGRYLRHAVESGQCLIILDGLDEVTDPALRLRITENIQQTVAGYSTNRFLVTSRIVGYDRSPLTREFKHATLSELDADDRERFVQLWFEALSAEIETTANSDATQSLIQVFRDKPQIGRLAANPLLLTIMILMYWRGVKLPNRRVQIYENATDTLIEYWTTHRGIDLDAHEIKSILAPIAHHILSSNVGGVIAQHALLPLFYQGIVKQRGCSVNEAHKLGRNLLRELGEQSGIFLERGLDANGNPVYGFLHQTFGEYLAGLRVAEEVLDGDFDVQKYIHRSVWHEPILLAAGHLSLISQGHLHDFLYGILNYPCSFEQELHRNLLLTVDCMTEDIQPRIQLRNELLERLVKLLFHDAQQLREAAIDRIRKLTTTRHKEAVIELITERLSTITDVDSIPAKARFSIAHALVHLDETRLARPYLFPLEHERYREDIRTDKVQSLRVEGWPDEADDYLYELYIDKEKTFYLQAEPDLSDFIFGPSEANRIRDILGVQRMLALVSLLLEHAHDHEDKAIFRFLAAIIPETVNSEALYALITDAVASPVRCFAAIRLLDGHYHNEAIGVLKKIVSTEPDQAPRAATTLIRLNEHHELDWALLRDSALIGDDENCTPSILALFDGGQHQIALPAALHLLALYPARTISRREICLWPVVEALLTHDFAPVGLAAANWLALRPGYSHRLQACDALLQAGKVEEAIPLYQYLAYECHDEASHEATRKLLILKELDRLIPLLAGSVESDVAESKYQACLGLALADTAMQNCHEAAQPRWQLKTDILEQRTITIEHALEIFCDVGKKTLLHLNSDNGEYRYLASIANISLNMMREYAVAATDEPLIALLLQQDLYPIVQLNAAKFTLCIGNLERAYEALTFMVRTPDSLSLPAHSKALQLIGRFNKPETLEIMIQALDSERNEIRRIAAAALGPLGDLRATPHLLACLSDKDKNTQRAAIRSIGLLGDRQAIPELVHVLLTDTSELARGSAALSLGQLGDPQIIKEFQIAQNDSHQWVRRLVVEALRAFNSVESIPLLLNSR